MSGTVVAVYSKQSNTSFNPFHATGFFLPENIRKPEFFMFARGIEIGQWHEMGKNPNLYHISCQ